MKWLTTLFLSFFSIGFIPGIEGTLASAVSLPIIAQLFLLLPADQPNRILAYGSVIVVLVGFGTVAIRHCKKIPKKDCDQSFIVIDEVTGMMVALLPLMMASEFSWRLSLIAFLLFRFFDIVKPLGIRKIDQMNTPLSVMLDDVVAGLYSAALLWILF